MSDETELQDGDYQADDNESAAVSQWQKRIASAIEFDEEARKGYAMCRSYARGDSSFSVNVPLLASYIDVLVAFVYAKDPDIDVLPADRVSGDRASRMVQQQDVKDNRAFARTLEVIVSRLLKDAGLKDRAKRACRSAMTVPMGWIKATWQERMGEDPVVLGQIRDLQNNLEAIKQQSARIQSGDTADLDAEKAELEQKIAGLQANVEVMVARGLYLDRVAAEDMIIPECVASVTEYLQSPWLGQRIMMTRDRAKIDFPDVAEKISNATKYSQIKEPAREERKSGQLRNYRSDDASQFQKGGQGDMVCVYEVWDAESNRVLTFIDGLVDCYARRPYSPTKSTRFYPFFGLSFTEVDGQRHPVSLVERSIPLMDEINRTMDAWARHRRRIKPGTIFNRKVLDAKDAKALAKSTEQEMVGVAPIDAADGANYDMRKLLIQKQYAAVDPMVYDTGPPRAQLEAVWGVSEALSSTIQTEKTATEAEIQHSGTQARTGAMRDATEGMLGELAYYTAEIALGKIDLEDAREIAGPEAFWPPEPLSIEQLRMLVTVDIRAGSTGKPNTAAQREAWGTVMPLLQGLIQEIAILRRSPPEQVADCFEELAVETLERLGDRADITRFMPQEGMPVPMVPGAAPTTNPTGAPADPMAAANPSPGAPPGAPLSAVA